MQVRKEILGVPAPKRAFDSQYHDKKCPFTGTLPVKKELLKGKVVKKDTNKSATIEWFRPFFIPKYERYEIRRSRLRVHNPPCIDAQVGQRVLVARTRPLSKTKNHVIIQILEGFEETSEKEAKMPARKKKEIKNKEEAKGSEE
ncbi:MAG: 30S ribosomal protein S17 [Nanoarchaeota archaeon]|nr:30S ribosomal protein S17 [Nanoarchaeota archaeon]MBU1644482.1 30S ribosomal protein S17 [Nanoarchaeota archaeon]MBU1976486.1 30S ribosomal protein S17 [Nanoarchaeota archaeon]